MTHTDLQLFLEDRMQVIIASHLTSWSAKSVGLINELEDALKQQAQLSNSSGKRFRAQLLLATYCAAQPSETPSVVLSQLPQGLVDLACALEIFQTAALVHDDIVDQSPLRRHQPSAHVALGNTYHRLSIQNQTAINLSESPQNGQALGILLGNLLTVIASNTTNYSSETFDNSSYIRSVFHRMMGEVNQGQVCDLGMEIMPLHDPDALQQAAMTTIALKTSSYTTVAPIELGLLAAGKAPKESQDVAQKLGNILGLAYQLNDDLLDVTVCSINSGKPQYGDIYEGKRTVLLAQALKLASPQEQKSIIELYEARERTSEDVARIVNIYEQCGAVEAVNKFVDELTSQAIEVIQDTSTHLAIPTVNQELLRNACLCFLPNTSFPSPAIA